MRHEQIYHGNSIAFEIDADYIDGPDCSCALCRPHSALLAFASRDGLTLEQPLNTPPHHHFNRPRLTHTFSCTSLSERVARPMMSSVHDGLRFNKAG